MVCTYLIELVAGIMTGYIFIYLDDAIVMRFALSILYIPAVLVLVDAKSKMVRFLVYVMLTAVCFWGVLYAIYFRRPFGFSLIFCAIVGFVYYVIFTEPAKKDKLSKILIVNFCFFTLVFLIALSCNLMFNPRHAGLLNGGAVMW
jgi:branched-subunit amino acid transport protein